jgi:hypothetical protein
MGTNNPQHWVSRCRINKAAELSDRANDARAEHLSTLGAMVSSQASLQCSEPAARDETEKRIEQHDAQHDEKEYELGAQAIAA